MLFSTPDPLLTVQESRMCHIDPQNPSALFSMWSVFSKASGFMEQGQRLEHMSWRLWAHQSIRERSRRQQRSAANGASRASNNTLPSLSSSVDSLASADSDVSPCCTHELNVGSFHVDEMPAVDLTHLVSSIKHSQVLDGPLSPLPSPLLGDLAAKDSHQSQESVSTPRPTSPQPVPNHLDSSASTINSVSSDTTRMSPAESPATSAGSAGSDHSVVRGFTPGMRSSYRSQTLLSVPQPNPILKSSNRPSSTKKPKKTAQFQIGSGGSGSSDGSVTLQENMSPAKSLSCSQGSSGKRPSAMRKQTSFKSEITEIPALKKKTTFELGNDDDDEGAIEDDSDEDASQDEEVSESAIDDDDDAWEDEGEGDDVAKELTFHRVDSRPELVSRRSAIWDQLHGWNGNSAPNQTSERLTSKSASASHLRRARSSMPYGPAGSSVEDDISEELRSPRKQARGQYPASAVNLQAGVPIITPTQTRKQMINEELGVSLRKHMLNERQQRYHMSKGDLPRRHTSVDMRKLIHEAEVHLNTPHMAGPTTSKGETHGSWNDGYENPLDTNYHQSGW